MTKCWNCGHENVEDADICDRCGVPLEFGVDSDDAISDAETDNLLLDVIGDETSETHSDVEVETKEIDKQADISSAVFDDAVSDGSADFTYDLPSGEAPDLSPVMKAPEKAEEETSMSAAVFDDTISDGSADFTYDLPSGEAPDLSPVMKAPEEDETAVKAKPPDIMDQSPDLSSLKSFTTAPEIEDELEIAMTVPSMRTPMLGFGATQLIGWLTLVIVLFATVDITDPNINLSNIGGSGLSSYIHVHAFFYLLMSLGYILLGYLSTEFMHKVFPQAKNWFVFIPLLVHLALMLVISTLVIAIFKPEDILQLYLFAPFVAGVAFTVLGGAVVFYAGATVLHDPIQKALTGRSSKASVAATPL